MPDNMKKQNYDYEMENSKLRFKEGNPHTIKKILKIVIYFVILTFFFASRKAGTIILTILFGVIPVILKIIMAPGDGIKGRLYNYFGEMYRKYKIETLPVKLHIEKDNITVCLQRAEKIRGHVVNETYTIPRTKIAGILYDDVSRDILIMFQNASVKITDTNTDKNIRTFVLNDSTLCFEIENNDAICNNLYEFMYPLEILSDIEDAEQEISDPELTVNKLYVQAKEAKEQLKQLKK